MVSSKLGVGSLSGYSVLYGSLTASFGLAVTSTTTCARAGQRLPATTTLPKSLFAHPASKAGNPVNSFYSASPVLDSVNLILPQLHRFRHLTTAISSSSSALIKAGRKKSTAAHLPRNPTNRNRPNTWATASLR